MSGLTVSLVHLLPYSTPPKQKSPDEDVPSEDR